MWLSLNRGTFPGNCPFDRFILDLQPAELWENKFLFFKPLSLWYFVMATWANEYTGAFLHSVESSPLDMETQTSFADQSQNKRNYLTIRYLKKNGHCFQSTVTLCFVWRLVSPLYMHNDTKANTSLCLLTRTALSFLRQGLPFPHLTPHLVHLEITCVPLSMLHTYIVPVFLNKLLKGYTWQ